MGLSQEHSLEVRLMLLYSSTIAIGDELTELRRTSGTAAYQIGKELEVWPLPIVSLYATCSRAGQHQKVFATDPSEPFYLPLQGQDSEGVPGGK